MYNVLLAVSNMRFDHLFLTKNLTSRSFTLEHRSDALRFAPLVQKFFPTYHAAWPFGHQHKNQNSYS